MLRKRTNAHATVDDHMRTVCSVGTPAVAVAQLPAPTMTGRLVVTPVEKMCTALGPDSKRGRSYTDEHRWCLTTTAITYQSRARLHGDA